MTRFVCTVAFLSLLVFVGCTDSPAPLPTGSEISIAPEAAFAPGPTCELGVSEADARAEIAALQAEIDALEDAGALNSGQARALRNKLDNALRHLDAGRLCPALAQLRAFRNQVEDFVGAGVLTGPEAGPLLDGAEVVLDGAPPVIVEGTITTGLGHTCALTPTGAAYCWGRNDAGQIGDGSTTDRSVPTAVSGGRTFAALAAGGAHTCALEPDGTAWCWGYNSGELGDGTRDDSPVPVPVSGGHVFVAISAGAHTCALKADGAAFCWGPNRYGQLGIGTSTPGSQLTPTAVVGGHAFGMIDVGSSVQPTTCAVRTDGAAYCWGYNAVGTVGDGTMEERAAPTAVAGGHLFSEVTVGGFHACATRTSDASAWCWGTNTHGEGGGASRTLRLEPVAVDGGRAFEAINAGARYTCAVDLGGDAFCWGLNEDGQLGNGTTDDSDVPVAVSGGHTFTSISTGTAGTTRHTCGARTDGALLCWGSNDRGQLGDGSTTGSSTPIVVPGWTSLP